MTRRKPRPIILPTTRPGQQCLVAIKAAGYTQTQISQMSGMSQSRISKWLQGQETRATRDLYALLLLLSQIVPTEWGEMIAFAVGKPLIGVPAKGVVGRPKKKGVTGGKSKKVRPAQSEMG